MITVATSGCFDCLHVGHLDLLEYAKSLGGELIVGINSDDSIRKLKGESRPIHPAMDRRRMLLALKSVDRVYVFYEDSAYRFLSCFTPDVWVKGGSYSLETIDPRERESMEAHNGRIIFFHHINHRSTTDIIERIRGRNS